MTKPHAAKGSLCPFWRKDMALVCHKCPLWTHLRGKNPQSGQEIDEWGCALAWLPLLLVEGAQQTRQAGAAIESFRNEMIRLNEDRGQMTEDGPRLTVIIPPSVVRRLSSD